MALYVKNILALSGNNSKYIFSLVNTIFLWTKPQSMRIKIRITVQFELEEKVTIQQRMVVEFFVQFKQCLDCNHTYTNHTWHLIVQLQQKRDNDSKKKR